MVLEAGQQIATIYMLSIVSRKKGNHAMKLGRLIEYNMENIFLEKSDTNFCRAAVSKTFYRKSKLSVDLDQQSEK